MALESVRVTTEYTIMMCTMTSEILTRVKISKGQFSVALTALILDVVEPDVHLLKQVLYCLLSYYLYN